MKLPITPVLYLTSLGFLGGIVHSVYEYTQNKKKLVVSNKAIKAEVRRVQGEVKKKGASDNKNWDYSVDGFWTRFREANFTGKVEKILTKQPETVTKKADTPSDIPKLAEIFQIVCITNAGDDTGVVIKYIADVDVPEGLIPKATSPIASTMPAGRMRPGRKAPSPRPMSVQAPLQHLRIGSSLWPKYQHVKLKSVDPDARFAKFEIEIEAKKDKDGNFPTQDVYKPALHLSQEVLIAIDKLRKGGGGGAAAGPGTIDHNAAKTDNAAGPVWVDVPKTKVRRDGSVIIARKDQRFLEDNGPKIFTDDVHIRDYSGGTGKHRVRGVVVRKLSNRVRQFGVNEGDVIISINGIPVSGMANAKKTGRRLYNKGVRNFRAEILRMGRVIERTFTFKK